MTVDDIKNKIKDIEDTYTSGDIPQFAAMRLKDLKKQLKDLEIKNVRSTKN